MKINFWDFSLENIFGIEYLFVCILIIFLVYHMEQNQTIVNTSKGVTKGTTSVLQSIAVLQRQRKMQQRNSPIVR